MKLSSKNIVIIGLLVMLCAGTLSLFDKPVKQGTLQTIQTPAESAVPATPKQDNTKKQAKEPLKPKVLEYTIQQGDTLSSIARRYGTDVTTITAANQMGVTTTLKLGQKIKVLNIKGVLHKVGKGQTIWQIARGYGLPVQTVMAVNGIKDESQVQPGQELILPGAKPFPGAGSTGGGQHVKTGVGIFSGYLAMPVHGRLTSRFGYRWGRMHEGLDLAAPTGTPVHAAGGGVVAFAGWKNGYGKTVIINHGNGYTTLYGHNSKFFVSAGQKVASGQRIANVGSTGRSTGPHLHFEVHIGGKVVNPAKYLR